MYSDVKALNLKFPGSSLPVSITLSSDPIQATGSTVSANVTLHASGIIGKPLVWKINDVSCTFFKI